jgi:threonine 3-dehydrogenase
MTTPSTTPTIQALTFDTVTDGWTTSTGFFKRELPAPVLDEKAHPDDAEMAIVRPILAGVCGSDRGIWFRRAFGDTIQGSLAVEHRTTRVIGHEFLGEIVAIGSRARETTGLREGDTVAAESHITCGHCVQCRNGDTHVCVNTQIIGISADGCFAERAKLPAKILWKTDLTKIRPEVAAVQEPFGNAVHACTTVDVKGKTVAILGAGTIGLFAVAVAKALGAKTVIVAEPDPANRERARLLGADHIVALDVANAPKGEHAHEADPALVAAVMTLTGGLGAEVTLDMFGANSSVNNAIAVTGKAGHVILFGVYDGDFRVTNFKRIIMDGIHLHGVVGRRVFETWHVTRALLEDKSNGIQDKIWEVILNRGVGTRVRFADYDRASFEQTIKANPKVLIEF